MDTLTRLIERFPARLRAQSVFDARPLILSIGQCLRLSARRTEHEPPDIHALVYPFNYLQLAAAAAVALGAACEGTGVPPVRDWRMHWACARLPGGLCYVVCDWTLHGPDATRGGRQRADSGAAPVSALLSRIRDGHAGLPLSRSASPGVRLSASSQINTIVQDSVNRVEEVEGSNAPRLPAEALCRDIDRAMRDAAAEPAREMLSGFYCQPGPALAPALDGAHSSWGGGSR